MPSIRIEKDSIGEMKIPETADYASIRHGTLKIFRSPGFCSIIIRNLCNRLPKKAAAVANRDLGALKPEIAEAIIGACDQIIAGKGHELFVEDLLQGGAGTSTNMNANEVIANMALRQMGKKPGDYAAINPNDHVNLSQSLDSQIALKAAFLLLYRHDSTITRRGLADPEWMTLERVTK